MAARPPLTWVTMAWFPAFPESEPASLKLQPAFCFAVLLCESQENLSINNNTLSAACVVDFVLPGHPEKKRLYKEKEEGEEFFHIRVLFYKNP